MTTSEWDWTSLGPAELKQRWQSLATWVRWLLEHYSTWVKLPPCWPRHEALRSELEFFRAWHAQLLEDGDATEGTNWHSSLRSAATAWMDLADCEHDTQFSRRTGRGRASAAPEHPRRTPGQRRCRSQRHRRHQEGGLSELGWLRGYPGQVQEDQGVVLRAVHELLE